MRPCTCDRFELDTPYRADRDCRLCWLFAHDGRYRAAWNEPSDSSEEFDETTPQAGMCVRCLLRLLEGGREGWPIDWPHWPVTAEAYRLAFAGRIASRVELCQWKHPRGVVICSGGWRFFASLYVTVRVLRQVGCILPIEVWYLGVREFDPRMESLLLPYGPVRWVDAHGYCREHGIQRRRLGGWELKPFAARYSDFREVLVLDADCYPAFDPTFLFDHPEYVANAAIFWPDNPDDPHGRLQPGQWQRWGLQPRDEPSFESGQFLIDRGRCARALSVCDWMNNHSDYTYLHQYGDKDTYHLAWRGTATPYVIAPTVQWHDVAFLQRDLEGGTLFVHRCRDKFRLGAHGYCTAQRADANVWSAGLPHEAYCHRVLGELERLLNPEKEFQLRPGTWDKDIWHHITILNEYRLPERFRDEDVIVDIGGHVGSFVHAVLSRGAGRVIVVEPDPENLDLLRTNAARYGDRVKIHAGAAWRCDIEYPATLSLDSPPEWANTGARACGLSTVKPGAGESLAVQALSFDDLLEQAGQTIRLLKIDCEGSEFPILFTSRLLHRVQEIAGEYHEIGIIPEHARVSGHACFTAQALADYLEKQGFSVTLVPTGPEVGLFFARRS